MPDAAGYLWKTDPNAKHWRRRYFVLSGSNLGYRKKASSNVFIKDPIDLSCAKVYSTPDDTLKLAPKTPYGFRVVLNDGSRTYNLCATSEAEQVYWCEKIRDITQNYDNEEFEEDDDFPEDDVYQENNASVYDDENGENNANVYDDENGETSYNNYDEYNMETDENQSGIDPRNNTYPNSYDNYDGTNNSNSNNNNNNSNSNSNNNNNNSTENNYRDHLDTFVEVEENNNENDEVYSLTFFLVLVGSERKFQVTMPENEAEELTIREIKENFTTTLGASVENIILSIDGEVLRNDFKGYEFGLTDGTEIEVSLKGNNTQMQIGDSSASNKIERKQEEHTVADRDGIVRNNYNNNNSPGYSSQTPPLSPRTPRSPPPPPPPEDENGVNSHGIMEENQFTKSSNQIPTKLTDASSMDRRPSVLPPAPPTMNDSFIRNSNEYNSMNTRGEKLNLEVMEGSKMEIFSLNNDKDDHQRLDIGIKQFCKINGLEFESVGPMIAQHIQAMGSGNDGNMNTPVETETKQMERPVSPQVRKELSVALLNNQNLNRKCNELEMQLKIANSNDKNSLAIQRKYQMYEDQIKEYKKIIDNQGISSSKLLNDNSLKVSEHRHMLERLKREYEQKEYSLKLVHENETKLLQSQIQELDNKAKTYMKKFEEIRVLRPETHDEQIIALQEEVKSLKKRLKAARTLSNIERNDLEIETLHNSFSSPKPEHEFSQLASIRSPDLSRGQWRQFMEEKRNIIARGNRDREKLMLENRRLRQLLSQEQGEQQQYNGYGGGYRGY